MSISAMISSQKATGTTSRIRDTIEPFRETTKRLEGHAHEGHHGSVWEVLVIEALLPIYEAGRQNEEDHRQEIQPTPLEIAYHTAWKKLDEYYKKTDATHQIYAAAVLIYPQFRKAYFQDNWKDSWMRTMVSGVKRHWKEVYQPLDDVDKDNDLSDQSPPHKQARHQLDFLDKHLSEGTCYY